MKLKGTALVVVDQDGVQYSVTVNELQGYLAGLAQPFNEVTLEAGKPGLMFPGPTLTYNTFTGQLDAIIPPYLNYYGDIIIEDTFGTKTSPNGTEPEGAFYIVKDDVEFLNMNWGRLSGETVYIGDWIVKGINGDWLYWPSRVVSFIKTDTNCVELDYSDSPYLKLDITTAVAPDLNTGEEGQDGLISKEDQNKIDTLNSTYLTIDFRTLPTLPNVP